MRYPGPMKEPEAGDVILYDVNPHSGWTSRAVAIGELIAGIGKGPIMFSHVALYDHGGFQYEAKYPKAGRFPVDLRRRPFIIPVPGISPDQRKQVIATARSHVGDHYNLLGLFSLGILGLSHQEVCSQLVDDCLRAARIFIPREGQKLLTPNAIADWLGVSKGR